MDDAESRQQHEFRAIVHKYDRGREPGAQIDDWEDPKFEIYHKKDRYGFLHDERLPESGKRGEREQKQIQVEVSRSMKWAVMMDHKEQRKYFGPNAKQREKMINRVYKGVPDSVRGKLWHLLLDLDRLKQEQHGVYERMRDIARMHSPDIRQIDLDINRTYRDNLMFRERYNGKQKALFHVLAAYSIYNTEVGYCQGMSQIAALLLMYLIDEEDCFWALSQLMANPKYAMHGFFISGFPKLLRYQAFHDRLLKRYLPKLKKHFDRHGVDSSIYTLKWFFQCFLDRLPFCLNLRVWDLYLLEGERVLVANALNILKMHRRYLLKLGMDEIIEHLQVHLKDDFGFDDDVVIERLRELMHELRSDRLDYPGPPPLEELPQKPFGLVASLSQPSPSNVGLRATLTDKEREFSKYNLQRQSDDDELKVLEDISYLDEGSEDDMEDSASLPRDSVTPAFGDKDEELEEIGSDHMDGVLNTNGREYSVLRQYCSSRSPLPESEAQTKLDDCVKFMLQSVSDLNGRGLSSPESAKKTLDRSFESDSASEVVRIKVPYCEMRSGALPISSQGQGQMTQYEGNKILISVNQTTALKTANLWASHDHMASVSQATNASHTMNSDAHASHRRQVKSLHQESLGAGVYNTSSPPKSAAAASSSTSKY